MLLRRHKINMARQSHGEVEPEKKQQDTLFGNELKYEPEAEKFPAQYTKTDINRMPVSELRELAGKHGVEDPESMSGADLKEYLISKLGL